MASYSHQALYIGMSGKPQSRVAQQKGALAGGARWALKYKTMLLVHIEFFEDYPAARERETKLKKWPREWKVNLIEAGNPAWQDLTPLLAERLN